MDSTPGHQNQERIDRWLMDFSVAMLTTIDDHTGSLRSRPMAMVGGKFLGEVTFFTLEATGKVDEVEAERQVNVALADPATGRYLSLSGRASLVRDRAGMADHWNESMLVWFPDGLQTAGLAMLRVRIQSAEYWDRKNRMQPEYVQLT